MPRVQQKRGTAANLASVDPTPAAGELIVVSDENTLVIGNGSDSYTSLAYVTATPRSHTHTLSQITDLNIASVGSPAVQYDVALSYNYSSATWSTKTIGDVGVGSQPLGGWPTGSLGNALAEKAGVATTLSGYGITDAVSSSDSRLTDSRTPTDGSVTTAKIADDAVTYAKIQNVSATDRLLGRASGGAGDVEEITCTAFGRSLIDDANATGGRETLGLGTLATVSPTGTPSSGTFLRGDGAWSQLFIGSVDGLQSLIDSKAALAGAVFTGQVEFDRTLTDTSITRAVFVDGNYATTATAQRFNFGIEVDARKTVSAGVTDTGYIMGLSVDSYLEGAGDLSEVYALRFSAGIRTGATGNVTNAYGIRARVLDLGSGGDIATGYGVYIDDVQATTGYGVYQVGSGDRNYFAGNVGVGLSRTNPTSALDVNGVITVIAGTGASGSYLPSVAFTGDPNTGIQQIGGADNFSIVTGGFERLRVRADGGIAVGYDGSAGHAFGIQNATSAVGGSHIGLVVAPTYQPDALTLTNVWSEPKTAGAVNTIYNYQARPHLSGGTATSVIGYHVPNTFTAGTNSFGIRSEIPSGTNRWNCYVNGTAQNYFGGNVGIGSGRSVPAAALDVNGSAIFSASSGVAMTITNTGTGNSFVVNDASGDTTPFVIDADGRVAIGHSTPTSLVELRAPTDTPPQLRITAIGNAGTSAAPASRGSIAFPNYNLARELVTLESIGREVNFLAGMFVISVANAVGTSESVFTIDNQSSAATFGVRTTLPLHCSSTITVSAGSEAAPSLTISGDSNTGLAQVGGADTLSAVVAGSERLRVGFDSIDVYQATAGTSVSRVRLNSSAGSSQFAVLSYGASYASATVLSVGAGGTALAAVSGTLGIATLSGSPLTLGTNSVERVRIKSTGAVRFVPLAADPASGNEAGDVYYSSSASQLKYHTGSLWVGLAAATHTHDDRYYTETEVNGLLSAKANTASPTFTGTTTFSGPITEGYVAGGNTGTAKTIALTTGTVQAFTLTGNCTFTMPTAVAGQSFTVMLKTGAESYSATFTGVKWPNNTGPVATATASRLDLFTFVSDGTNWYGAVAQNYSV